MGTLFTIFFFEGLFCGGADGPKNDDDRLYRTSPQSMRTQEGEGSLNLNYASADKRCNY